MSNLREDLKQDYKKFSGEITVTEIKIGCLQRIADATELMSKGYLDMRKEIERLEADSKMYRNWYQEWVQRCNRRDRQIAALRGVITKMKKKLETNK